MKTSTEGGLIQIRKYAELQQETELLSRFKALQGATKAVKKVIYTMLVEDCRYFE